jgi:hypothetical protein
VAQQGDPHLVITHGYLSSQWMHQRSVIGQDPDAHINPAP